MDFSALGGWLAGQLLKPLLPLVAAELLQTPHVEREPAVAELNHVSLGIAVSALVLAVVWLGISVMARGVLPTLPTGQEALSRLALAVTQVAAAELGLGRLVDLSNACALALALDASGERYRGAGSDAAAAAGGDVAMVLLLALLVLTIAAVLVLAVVRTLVLAAAAALAPLALMAYAVPQLEGISSLWWRVVAAMLTLPVLDAVLLSLGLSVSLGVDGSPLARVVTLLGLTAALIALPLVMGARLVLPPRRSLSGLVLARVED